ncbi:MAG: hypothetical protein JRJ87_24315 [Deltaproteobacteria bacterium]|nr:hypothetical protein [Deltaproteobacteria bacterium]
MADAPDEVAAVIASDNIKRSWWIPSVFGMTCVVVLVVTTFVIHIKADDIWWHLKTGELILNLMNLPQENIFSFSAPGHYWLPHEWLAEVVFFGIYNYLGPLGLIAFGILLNAIACALIYKLTVRYSNSPYISALITLLAALMMLGNFSLRPYLFGNIFFVCTLHAMEEPSAGGRIRPVILFLLFAAWANFHGSFIIGLALILLYAAAKLTTQLVSGARNFSQVKPFLLDFVVALVACVVTPNHVFGLIFPLIYIQKAFSSDVNYLTNISEWQPAGLSTPLGQMITFYLMFCGFAIVGSRRTPKPVHIGLLVAFATFAYTSIRNIPLLGIAATTVLARHLPTTLGRTWRMLTKRTFLSILFGRLHNKSVELDRRSRGVLLPALAVIGLIVIFVLPASSGISYRSLTKVESLPDLSPNFYPRGLIVEMDKRDSINRVFNYFNWGGAFIWTFYPRGRVFIDQRNDCYPEEVFKNYFAVHRLERDWREVLDRWRIDTIAYPPNERLTKALREESSWKVVYEDRQAVLFERIVLVDEPEAD